MVSTYLLLFPSPASCNLFYWCIFVLIFSYFLDVINKDINLMKGMRLVTNIISKLCQNSNVARTLVIRELLESSLFRSPNVLFGATRESTTILTSSNISLLDENHRQVFFTLLFNFLIDYYIH